MKKLGIIIISLLICETSYAGYITIEKEKIIIGDGTGGDGDDTISGGPGTDTIDGGPGNNTIYQ